MGNKVGKFKERTDKARHAMATEIAIMLKRRRDALGKGEITQDALAHAMDTSRNTVVRIEAGKFLPTLDTLYVYQESLDKIANLPRRSWREVFHDFFKLSEAPAAFFTPDTLEAHRNLAKILSRGGERSAAIKLILNDECFVQDHLPEVGPPDPQPGGEGPPKSVRQPARVFRTNE